VFVIRLFSVAAAPTRIAGPTFRFGILQFWWLRALNASSRNWNVWCSRIGNTLWISASRPQQTTWQTDPEVQKARGARSSVFQTLFLLWHTAGGAVPTGGFGSTLRSRRPPPPRYSASRSIVLNIAICLPPHIFVAPVLLSQGVGVEMLTCFLLCFAPASSIGRTSDDAEGRWNQSGFGLRSASALEGTVAISRGWQPKSTRSYRNAALTLRIELGVSGGFHVAREFVPGFPN
jgi:hypothetical protein